MSALLVIALGADPGLDAVMRAATLDPPADGRARVERWVAAHLDSPEVATALLWEAQSFMRDGRYDDADRLLAAVTAGPPPSRWEAALLRADLQLAQRHWIAAEQAYRALGAPTGSRWAYDAEQRAALARSGGRRQAAMWAVLAALGLLVLWRGVAVGRALWPPPEELIWVGPVLAVMMLAALPRAAEERDAILLVGAAGLLLLWINGAWLRARPPRGPRRIAEAVLGLTQAAGALYCAVVLSGLWDAVANTLEAGTE